MISLDSEAIREVEVMFLYLVSLSVATNIRIIQIFGYLFLNITIHICICAIFKI